MKILIIQTAFIGDVILATSLIEKIASEKTDFRIDFLLRSGNEFLLTNHPFVNEVLIWHKLKSKFKELPRLIREVRIRKYDLIINLQRFYSTGFITALSEAQETRGFNKNPLSLFFTKSFKHQIAENIHEVDRNLSLLKGITTVNRTLPKLYPSDIDIKKAEHYQTNPYVCIAPASVWFTKQFPENKWVELINKISTDTIYLVGSISDNALCERIANRFDKKVVNLAGKLTLLQSAALFSKAKMNYVNDSAPLHIASAMNAPVTAIFCSTVPRFGFGPLSQNATIAQIETELSCRPCGLHGFNRCPKKHFKCALDIDIEKYAI